ncbi:MAG: ATP-binding protein, partial [Candidatus Nanoarchaeia archaeon]
KQKKIALKELPSSRIFPQKAAYILEPKSDSARDFVDAINKDIIEKTDDLRFKEFAKVAHTALPALIAPGIIGFDSVKKAVAIQLFSKEKIHILLLGDPGTGKTKILDAATKMHPISSMGVGSGTSGAGLAVTVRGNEVLPGLLPMADRGLCAIDELNLMKDEARASLYNAMESGFVSYSKGGKHIRFDARVSVLATANPKGDRFKGSDPGELRKQMPFDPALLSRFHLTFFVRRPDVKMFKHISKQLLSNKKDKIPEQDLAFVKRYIKRANDIKDVSLPKRFEQEVVDFLAEIKTEEDKHLIEVSPRLVVGFMRMAKALARSELRNSVEDKDIQTVKQIVKESIRLDT